MQNKEAITTNLVERLDWRFARRDESRIVCFVRGLVLSQLALVGFQGRGCADGVQPDFCHPLLLEALLLQWPSK